MTSATGTVRVRVRLPLHLLDFLDQFQAERGLDSRSAALAQAIEVLRQQVLEAQYIEYGKAQRQGLETYPPDNLDGLDQRDSQRWT